MFYEADVAVCSQINKNTQTQCRQKVQFLNIKLLVRQVKVNYNN